MSTKPPVHYDGPSMDDLDKPFATVAITSTVQVPVKRSTVSGRTLGQVVDDFVHDEKVNNRQLDKLTITFNN